MSVHSGLNNLSGSVTFIQSILCEYHYRKCDMIFGMVESNTILARTLIFACIASLLLSVTMLYFHVQNSVLLNEQSVSCPFMGGETAFCEMDSIAHIGAWQSMFTALPLEQNILSLLLLFVVYATIHQFWHKMVRTLSIIHHGNQLAFMTFHAVPGPLEDAFRKGILNSKAF